MRDAFLPDLLLERVEKLCDIRLEILLSFGRMPASGHQLLVFLDRSITLCVASLLQRMLHFTDVA